MFNRNKELHGSREVTENAIPCKSSSLETKTKENQQDPVMYECLPGNIGTTRGKFSWCKSHTNISDVQCKGYKIKDM